MSWWDGNSLLLRSIFLGAFNRRIQEVGKIFLNSSPLGSDRSAIVLRPCVRSPCESNFPRAPARSRGPIEGWLVFVIVFPQAFFSIKMEGLSRAMIFPYGRIVVLGALLTG